MKNEKSVACSTSPNRGAHIPIHAQYAGNRWFGMHVQLFSHMHGVEASAAVELFVRTKAIIPNFICHNCTICTLKVMKIHRTQSIRYGNFDRAVVRFTDRKPRPRVPNGWPFGQ